MSGQLLERPVRRIVVLRGGGVGDLVFAIPALRALRARFPDATLTVVGERFAAELVGPPRGPADEVIVHPPAVEASLRGKERDDHPEVEAFVRAVRASEPDLAVQLHGGGRTSNSLVRRFGARFAIGLRTPDAGALDATTPYVYWQSEAMRDLEVVALAGATPVELDPTTQALPHERAAAALAVDGLGDAPLALLFPGAGDPRRRWPAARFAAVATRLGAVGASVAIVGGEADRALADVIRARASGSALLDLTGRLSLGELVALAERAAVFVGNDSGPLHLAAASGSPTVGIFWAGNLVNAGRLFRARHRPVLSWQLACEVCGQSALDGWCEHDVSFVKGASIEDVTAAALELLELRLPAPATAAPVVRP